MLVQPNEWSGEDEGSCTIPRSHLVQTRGARRKEERSREGGPKTMVHGKHLCPTKHGELSPLLRSYRWLTFGTIGKPRSQKLLKSTRHHCHLEPVEKRGGRQGRIGKRQRRCYGPTFSANVWSSFHPLSGKHKCVSGWRLPKPSVGKNCQRQCVHELLAPPTNGAGSWG